jgi:hypothetical protein
MNVAQLLTYLTEDQIKTLTLEHALGIIFKVEAVVDVLEEEGHAYDFQEVVREVIEMYMIEELT